MSEPISDEQYLRDQEWRDEIADEHERLMAQIATLAAECEELKGEVANASALAFLRGLHVTDERADRMIAAALDARDDARAERDALRDELRGVRDLAKQAHEWCEDIVTNTGPQTIVRRLAKRYHTLPEETPMTTDTTMHPTDDTPAIISQIMAERDESIARLATARADALREARERVEKLSVVLTFEGEKMVYLDDVLAALEEKRNG